MSEDKVLVESTGAEAPVPFELLAGWDRDDETGPPAFGNEAQRWALNDFFCSLEKAVVASFATDHDELLRAAKEQVRGAGREW